MIYKLRELCIPRFSETFQQTIEHIVKSAHANLSKSKSLYSEAEELLLKELGLKNWQPNNTPVNIKQLKDSFVASGRLDAEYYQQKYDELFSKLSMYDYDIVKEYINFLKEQEIKILYTHHSLRREIDGVSKKGGEI